MRACTANERVHRRFAPTTLRMHDARRQLQRPATPPPRLPALARTGTGAASHHSFSHRAHRRARTRAHAHFVVCACVCSVHDAHATFRAHFRACRSLLVRRCRTAVDDCQDSVAAPVPVSLCLVPLLLRTHRCTQLWYAESRCEGFVRATVRGVKILTRCASPLASTPPHEPHAPGEHGSESVDPCSSSYYNSMCCPLAALVRF